MSTFHGGKAGAFPMIEDNCARLQDELSVTRKRLPERIQLAVPVVNATDTAAAACPGQQAISALARQDELEEQLALNRCRILAGNGKEEKPAESALNQPFANPLRVPPRHPVPRHKRLWRKFRENPRKYLADSKNPLLRSCRHLFKRKK
jgi:hypothetical protein